PLILRYVVFKPLKLILSLVVFLVPLAVMALPIAVSGLDPGSGFRAFAEKWQFNDSLYRLISWISIPVVGPEHQMLARIVVMVLLAALLVWLLRKTADTAFDLCERSLWIIAALFLLSPTQFPRYVLWMLPLLAVRPRTSLLLLTVLLPVYYLRYLFDAVGLAHIFDNFVVWIEYVPVWVMIGWEIWSERTAPS
ncbi:MAG: hypothetical protein ACYTAF_16835, partial [Planctomycetota bacterium]